MDWRFPQRLRTPSPDTGAARSDHSRRAGIFHLEMSAAWQLGVSRSLTPWAEHRRCLSAAIASRLRCVDVSRAEECEAINGRLIASVLAVTLSRVVAAGSHPACRPLDARAPSCAWLRNCLRPPPDRKAVLRICESGRWVAAPCDARGVTNALPLLAPAVSTCTSAS